MHSKNIPLFFIVASLASTSLGLHHLTVTARRSFDIILARQATSGPCAPICDSVQSSVSVCGASGTAVCICSSAIAAEVQACVNCAVGADPSASTIDSAKGIIEAYETTCPSASITINTNAGTPQSTLNTATSTAVVSATKHVSATSSVSKIVVGPSSTTSAPNTASSAGSTSTSTASIGGLPLNNSASTNWINLHWTVVLFALAGGNLLVF